eukprot:TRINITY_DN7494_c0_g1_i1.p1 TRINITY_DN7494_c0_g1~~TRINITY_DN7494_c0_g1_i1.p1  ORF type:complete len:283 (-),score=37.96 TRINITY_DN7494_c0_g1_i1:27-830(-)
MELQRVWETYALAYFSEFAIITVGTFIVHELAFILMNLFYLALDEYNLFQQYKIHPERMLKNEIKWGHFWNILRGHIFQLLPIQLLGYPIIKFFGISATVPFPSLNTFAIQFLVFNVLEDTAFYWVHVLMHTRWAFKKFHYVHHEFTTPFSLTGEIAHPVEFLCNFLIPILLGPFLMGYLQGVHIAVFWLWLTFRELRGTDAHSGYNLPFHPLRILSPIYGGPLAHDFHHQSYGRNSNFGGYKFWDWLMGTDQKYKLFMAKKQSAQE